MGGRGSGIEEEETGRVMDIEGHMQTDRQSWIILYL